MIRPTGDRVLVALPPREDVTVSAGGIVLVKDPDRFSAPTRGIVVALGEKTGTVDLDDVLNEMSAYFDALSNRVPQWDAAANAWIDIPARGVRREMHDAVSALGPASFDVEIGDCVLFPQSAGEEVHLDGIDYCLLREAEIIGVLEPKASAA